MTHSKKEQRKKPFKCWQTYAALIVFIVCVLGFLCLRHQRDKEKSILEGFGAGINVKDTMVLDANGSLRLSGQIGEEDFAQIASWGMDHVRIPFNYEYFIKMPEENRLDEENIKVLDELIQMAQKNGLNVVLDMHVGPGYTHINAGTNNGNPFLRNKTLQEKFHTFWRCMAERYKDLYGCIMFDLLNEVVEEPASRWNEIALKTIETIRAVNPQQLILFSGIESGSVNRLADMKISKDPYIVYGFHFYEPILFTHQGDLLNYTIDYRQEYGAIAWKGTIDHMDHFIRDHRDYRSMNLDRFADTPLNVDVIRREMKAVAEFQQKYPFAKLYCGEFGVIKNASVESKREYLRDVVTVMNELGVGHSCWAYTDTEDGWFAFVDWATRKPIDQQTVEVCAGMSNRK